MVDGVPGALPAQTHRLSLAERTATGHALRKQVARGAHAGWVPPSGRRDPIELLIQGRAHELGPGFPVRRVLPSAKRRTVGPFIFFDHFGPMTHPQQVARIIIDALPHTPSLR